MSYVRRSFQVLATLLGVLLAGYFVKPTVDTALIAGSRALDRLTQKHETSLLAEKADDLMALNTRSVSQISKYLDRLGDSQLSDRARQPPEAMRELLRQNLRYPPPGFDPAALPQITRFLLGKDRLGTYERVEIEALPGVRSIGVLITPASSAFKKLPLVIVAQGRGGPPNPTGPTEALASGIDRNLASWAVADGYAVWLPIFVFYTADGPDDIRERLAERAVEAGTTLPAIEIAKVIKSIDVLSRLPNIDPEKIAMAGHSYGGFYTLFTTALEPRIKVAIVSAYVNDRKQVLAANEPDGFLDWRFSDSLRLFDDVSVGRLIVPRPLLVIAGTYDQLFPIEGARSAAKQLREVYARSLCAERRGRPSGVR